MCLFRSLSSSIFTFLVLPAYFGTEFLLLVITWNFLFSSIAALFQPQKYRTAMDSVPSQAAYQGFLSGPNSILHVSWPLHSLGYPLLCSYWHVNTVQALWSLKMKGEINCYSSSVFNSHEWQVNLIQIFWLKHPPVVPLICQSFWWQLYKFFSVLVSK